MQTIEILSSENISNNYLKQFILTNLEKENILVDNKRYIYASYLKNLKKYQILIFKEEENEIFFHECKHENEVLLCENYFAFFVNNRLYFYQETKESVSKEQIAQFILTSLAIENIKFSEKINYNKTNIKNYKFIKNRKNILFKLFILYLFGIICLFYFLSFNDTKKTKSLNLQDIKTKLERNKEEYSFKSYSNKLIDLYYLAKQNSVEISSLELASNQKNCKVIISSTNKKDIYIFFDNYKTKIRNFKYNQLNKRYEADAEIRLF